MKSSTNMTDRSIIKRLGKDGLSAQQISNKLRIDVSCIEKCLGSNFRVSAVVTQPVPEEEEALKPKRKSRAKASAPEE